MSNLYLNGVAAHSKSKRNARNVLRVLADRAGNDGVAWPSHATIAAESGVSPRTVTRAIGELIGLGEIERVDAERRHKSPRYRILLQPEKRSQGGQSVYANAPVRVDKMATLDGVSIDNLSSSIDKLSTSTYARGINPHEPNTTTTASVDPGDDVVVVIFSLWAKNMPGALTPVIEAEIRDWIATYGADETRDAILTAIKADNRNAGYIGGILRNRSAGYTRADWYRDHGRNGDGGKYERDIDWYRIPDGVPDYMKEMRGQPNPGEDGDGGNPAGDA